jgi:hypothetical protein
MRKLIVFLLLMAVLLVPSLNSVQEVGAHTGWHSIGTYCSPARIPYAVEQYRYWNGSTHTNTGMIRYRQIGNWCATL